MTDAPERIWAWDDKTPTDRDKGWAACDAGTGSTEYIRVDLVAALKAENHRLREALREIEELNLTTMDENGHRWENSDLIGQEIRAALHNTEASHDD